MINKNKYKLYGYQIAPALPTLPALECLDHFPQHFQQLKLFGF